MSASVTKGRRALLSRVFDYVCKGRCTLLGQQVRTSSPRASRVHCALARQYHEGWPTLDRGGSEEGAELTGTQGGAAIVVDDEVGSYSGESCMPMRVVGRCHDKRKRTSGARRIDSLEGDLGVNATPARWHSVEEATGLMTSRASLRHSGSLRPAHRDGGVVRWLGDGQPWQK
jgi:hypothetical protein